MCGPADGYAAHLTYLWFFTGDADPEMVSGPVWLGLGGWGELSFIDRGVATAISGVTDVTVSGPCFFLGPFVSLLLGSVFLNMWVSARCLAVSGRNSPLCLAPGASSVCPPFAVSRKTPITLASPFYDAVASSTCFGTDRES